MAKRPHDRNMTLGKTLLMAAGAALLAAVAIGAGAIGGLARLIGTGRPAPEPETDIQAGASEAIQEEELPAMEMLDEHDRAIAEAAEREGWRLDTRLRPSHRQNNVTYISSRFHIAVLDRDTDAGGRMTYTFNFHTDMLCIRTKGVKEKTVMRIEDFHDRAMAERAHAYLLARRTDQPGLIWRDPYQAAP